MSSKINNLNIIRDHISTLYDKRNGCIWFDIFRFFVLPAVLTFLLVFFINPIITQDLLGIIASVFAIFTALLLSLLLLLYNISQEITKNKNTVAYKLLIETKSNISFLILISIFSLFTILLLSVITYGILPGDIKSVIELILSAVSYYLMGIFILTILMVLKRVYALLNEILM